MKKIVFVLSVLAFISCKKESEESFGKPTETSESTEKTTAEIKTPKALGKEIFEGKGTCIACHKTDAKLIGPSLQDIAKIYKEKNGDMISFLKGEGEALVDPTQYEVMKANFAITKTMSEEELKALEAYVYSSLK
nr:c-type cytochrome [uncultured Flavobacterium sp.]